MIDAMSPPTLADKPILAGARVLLRPVTDAGEAAVLDRGWPECG